MSDIDVNKYFKVFDDGCVYFMEDMVDELYKDIVDHNEQLQQANKTIESQKGLIKKFVESEQQLKAENGELKEQYKLAEPLFQACKIKDLKINKYKQCLDEIQEICIECDNNPNCLKCKFYNKCDGVLYLILGLIEQAEEE